MNQRANSLQAALAGAAAEPEPVKPKASPKKRAPAGQGRAVAKKTTKPATVADKEKKSSNNSRYRDTTVMVGGHFPPDVLRQLRMIAAEEDTTNQALIAEALDLLFTKKGKQKIAAVTAG